ncbi:MAG: hypothetical protein IPM16_09335 [Chloroflexi bacterium]|nr:hypothetical protein [Chloroflexota bacterium]
MQFVHVAADNVPEKATEYPTGIQAVIENIFLGLLSQAIHLWLGWELVELSAHLSPRKPKTVDDLLARLRDRPRWWYRQLGTKYRESYNVWTGLISAAILVALGLVGPLWQLRRFDDVDTATQIVTVFLLLVELVSFLWHITAWYTPRPRKA